MSLSGDASKVNVLLEAALGYIQRGWFVIPLHSIANDVCSCEKGAACTSAGKHPQTEHGFKDGSMDEATIRDWWTKWPDANVGIVTGAKSRLVVIDADQQEGINNLALLEAQHSNLPDTLVARSGGRGGLHYYFESEAKVQSSVGRLAEHIDVRAEGAYIIAPPSVRQNTYDWQRKGQVAALPKWVADLANRSQKMTGAKTPETIKEGERNAFLTRLAGSLRFKGLSGEEIVPTLQEVNRQRCDPPLDEDEVETIALGMNRYADPPKITEFDCTDDGAQQFFAAVNGQVLRYVTAWKTWLYWDQHRWHRDQVGFVAEEIRKVSRLVVELAELVPLKDARDRYLKWSLRGTSTSKRKAIKGEAEENPVFARRAEGWDANTMLLGCPNGVVDLSSGQIRDGQPEDQITLSTRAKFNSDARCDRWHEFLREVMLGDVDWVTLLHRAAGYSLLGSNREQLNFMSVGEGSNGKSVFLRTIQHVLGEYATSIPISAFDARSRTSHQESIANLPGIRFVVALEPPKHMALAGEKLKEIAGGDVQKVSRKHEHEFEFVSQASLWFGVNHPPAVADDSLGFWRKLLVIPFRRNFEDDPKKDPDLLEKLEAEAEGILQWLIQGCVEYQKQGLGLTGKLRRETEIYRREEDSIYAFLGDSTKEEANGRAKRSEMYPAYERWGTKNFISVAKLAKKSELFEVLRRKYQEVKVQGEMYFKGLRLTVEVEEDEDAEVEY